MISLTNGLTNERPKGEMIQYPYRMSASIEDSEFGNLEVFYSKYYKQMICGAGRKKGIGAKAIASTHNKMERRLRGQHFATVLKLGGGNGEHLDYIVHGFDRYILVDIRNTVLDGKWTKDSRIVSLVADAERLPFGSKSIDRVVVTCLLHHVDHPEDVLREISRVLKDNGEATIFLSCDPGLAVRFLRKVTTQWTARKLGYRGYDLMNARDHKNHVSSLLILTRHLFRQWQIVENWQPFRVHSWNLNGYIIIRIFRRTGI
jgi:ubiquinone/menaquinone biosynthesis C-methylase UbiE